jgi:hypothetical protein
MAGGREWTTTEVRRLHELRARRVKTVDICRILGRTKDAINGFLAYVPVAPGYPPGRRRVPRIDRWTAEDTRTLHELAEQGATAEQAALVLRRTVIAIKSRSRVERVTLLCARCR